MTIQKAKQAMSGVADAGEPAPADPLLVELIAVAHPEAPTVGPHVDRFAADLDRSDTRSRECTEGVIVVAGDVANSDAASGELEQTREHFAMRPRPERTTGERLEIEDVTDQVELAAAQVPQKVEQIVGLAVGTAEMEIAEEDAAIAGKRRHAGGSRPWRTASVCRPAKTAG